MPIKRYGNPFGKPVRRPKGKKKLAYKPREGYEYDLDSKDLPSSTKQGARAGTGKETWESQREKTSDIQRRHKRAQEERKKLRRHKKRLKKRGVTFTADPMLKAMTGGK